MRKNAVSHPFPLANRRSFSIPLFTTFNIAHVQTKTKTNFSSFLIVPFPLLMVILVVQIQSQMFKNRIIFYSIRKLTSGLLYWCFFFISFLQHEDSRSCFWINKICFWLKYLPIKYTRKHQHMNGIEKSVFLFLFRWLNF